MTKIAIIGAGLSGLTAANLLKDRAEITLFEKARGVSGRMSTRRAEPYFFDHGAQYFSARTQRFQNFIQPFIDQGLIERWCPRYVRFDGCQITESKDWTQGEPFYVGVPGMNEIAKHIAKDLTIHLNKKIILLEKNKKWQLIDDKYVVHDNFDWIICTAPSPQTIQLMPKGFKYYSDIASIQMLPCFSLMLGFSKALPLDFDAAHIINCDLSWLAINNSKPGRTGLFALIVHSSKEYALKHIDDEQDKIMQHLCSETSRIIGYDVSLADYKMIHSWRFANNATYKKFPAFIDHDLQLAACGDWCEGGDIESAFTAAYNLCDII